MNVQDLGENIRMLRIGRGITQQHIASAIGVTSQAVSKWERGENAPDLFLMPALAALFNTTADTLLGYERRTIRSVEGTILFSALSGYTSTSEGVPPEQQQSRRNPLRINRWVSV
ncbi:MAG: hypothetical protein CMN78_02910 [Spirochaetales bacterium]|nr:hypothetical protein [Spirochaetales bacterium]